MGRTGPIQSESQSLGDIGEATVLLILKKFKWTADLIKSDFGEDIDCNVFIDNTRTNYHLRCQVKSTKKDSQYIRKLKNGDYSISISSGLLQTWIRSFFPIFLIVYDEASDLCFWTVPVKQIMENPSKLEKEKTSIHVPKNNLFNLNSKSQIQKEVINFYHKILRLDESKIECSVTPVLMPNYRVIPAHSYFDFLNDKDDLIIRTTGCLLDLMPAWMSILKQITPSSALTSITLSSKDTDLDKFLDKVKTKLGKFQYSLKEGEWLAFIISPIKVISNNKSWSRELTYWVAYNNVNSTSLIFDHDYNFEVPDGFLSQITRRARSWDYNHYVCPQKDLAIQFFSSYEITPSIQNVDKIHDKNIKGQLIFWQCRKKEIGIIADLLPSPDLSIRIIDDSQELCLIAIVTMMFDPFIGLYSVAMDWDSFENGNVRNKLEKHALLKVLPGHEYTGKVPDFIEEALNRYSTNKYSKTMVTEMEYIAGFPLMLNERVIKVSRFQMIPHQLVKSIETKLNVENPNKKNFHIELILWDDTWGTPIYELSISWTPDVSVSSKNDYLNSESDVLKWLDTILPTKNELSLPLRNTYDILHIAGEIGFENDN